MKRILITLAAVLIAGTAYASDGIPTMRDATTNFNVAIKAQTRMSMCGRSEGDFLRRTYAINDAAEISGRDVLEILVESKGWANAVIAAARRKGNLDKFCDPFASSSSLYSRIPLASKASELTLETLATLNRLIDERRDADTALALCDMSGTDAIKTRSFILQSRQWSYEASGICWRGECRNGDQQLRSALAAVSDKKAVCAAYAEFLDNLDDHPINRYRYENMVSE
ncbi:hypothetical protein [Mesorhizobium sp. A623]